MIRRLPRHAMSLPLVMVLACSPPHDDSHLALAPLSARPEAEDPAAIEDQNDFMSAASPLGDQVVFTSQRTGDFHLWLMNVDGSSQHQLTRGPGNQMQGSWSPDGKRIVYLHMEEGVRSVAIVDADGSNVRLLTEASGSWPIPVWSPDGSRILYNKAGPSGTEDLWTIDPEGGEPELFLESTHPIRQGAWSPDGHHIVFSAHDGSDYEIYVADVDGGAWTRLTDNEENDLTPSWSPAGDRIVFQSPRAGRWTIFTIKPDGTEQTPITSYPMQWDPVWSYDGSEIFYNSARDGRRGIYVMTSGGLYPRKLTNTDPGSFVTAVREAGVGAAARLFREAHAEDPTAVFFYEREVQYLGENYLEMGDVPRALTLFEVNAEAYPESASAHADLGGARLAAGQLDQALGSFRRALELDPENSRIEALLARLDHRSGSRP